MYGYSEVFLVQRFLDVINMSDINKAIPHGCDNGALTDRFGVLIQGLLGIIAFSTLMCECATFSLPHDIVVVIITADINI